MKILIDMNLSPDWVREFNNFGLQAVHWSSVGSFDAPDYLIMEFARNENYVIFTHDLDFGTALALTKSGKPAIIQVRTQDVTIPHLSKMVIGAINNYQDLLNNGALLVLDENKQRIRILPL
ncbi:MAG: DUF5615 family PIN-like protein [Mucilaginibacter sp.]